MSQRFTNPPPPPPSLAVRALYDGFLQNALSRFFERANLRAEPSGSGVIEGPFEIDEPGDPCRLVIHWLGNRYILTVAPRWPFTAQERRFTEAIGAVLSARYGAILNPHVMAQQGDLFRGVIEDRFVGAFLDSDGYPPGLPPADRIASAIEVLRVAAVSSYENRPISTGVLLRGASSRGVRRRAWNVKLPYSETLTASKSSFRLADGLRTLFLVDDEMVVDVVDVERWAATAAAGPLVVPCAHAYQAHARAFYDGEQIWEI